MNNQLDRAIERYATALQSLEQIETEIEIDRVLRILNARDTVQIALKEQMPVPITQVQQVNIATRFFSGGVGLGGAVAVIQDLRRASTYSVG